MLPLISLGALVGSVVGFFAGSHLARINQKNRNSLAQSDHPSTGRGILSAASIHFLQEKILQEDEVILAVEEVPLDNRFGSGPLVSEHEFSRSATTAFKFDQGKDMERTVEIDLLHLLNGIAKERVSRSIGTEVDSEVTRRIRLKFEAAAGKNVHYRVIWKQSSRRGIVEFQMEDQTFRLPYFVTYGLHHMVESISEGPSLSKEESRIPTKEKKAASEDDAANRREQKATSSLGDTP